MGLVAKEKAGNIQREPVPAGLTRGVCCSIVDLGTHYDQRYDKMKHEVYIGFELPDHRDDFEVDGETKNLPRLAGKKYTMSLSERAKLRQHLQSWRNKPFTAEELAGFDISKLLGVPCMLNFGPYTKADGTHGTGIESIAAPIAGMPRASVEGEAFIYDIDRDGTNFPEAMPEWMQDIVMKSQELGGASAPAPAGGASDAAAYIAQTPPPVAPVSTPDVADVPLDEDLPF